MKNAEYASTEAEIEENGGGLMTDGNGFSVADAMALTNKNGMDSSVWPLWFLLFAGLNRNGGGLFGGGGGDAAAGATTASLSAMRDQVNGVLSAVQNNADLAQNASIKEGLCNLGNLIQQGSGQITAAICKCCCDLNQAICDLGFKTQMGFQGVESNICNQTQVLTAQSERNTQRIIDGQTQLLFAQKDSEIRELEEKLTDCKVNLSNQAQTKEILASLTPQIAGVGQVCQQCCPQQGCGCNGSSGGSDAQAIAVAVAGALAPVLQSITTAVQASACRFPGQVQTNGAAS